MDREKKAIAAAGLTASNIHYSSHLPVMLDQLMGDVGKMSIDRAYDTGKCYQANLARGATPAINPRRNARLSAVKDPPPVMVVQGAVLRRIKSEELYPWRTSSGAMHQGLAENAVSRFKALVGVQLKSRSLDAQQIEAVVKCRVLLNRMVALLLAVADTLPSRARSAARYRQQ